MKFFPVSQALAIANICGNKIVVAHPSYAALIKSTTIPDQPATLCDFIFDKPFYSEPQVFFKIGAPK